MCYLIQNKSFLALKPIIIPKVHLLSEINGDFSRYIYIYIYIHSYIHTRLNPLNTELNPICHLLALVGAHHILHVSRVRVNIFAMPLHVTALHVLLGNCLGTVGP